MNRSAHGSIRSSTSTVCSSKSFHSKMDKVSERLYDIVKSGSMVKRAQNKKRFTPVNYKQRWFELTKKSLSYFDLENVERRRERGRVPVKGVRLVETATVSGEGGDPFAPSGFPFQVGYCESNDQQQSGRSVPQYILYLLASSETERDDWIRAIRQVCEEANTPKSYRYHPGLWTGKRWSCCKGISRATFGCQAATHWQEANNNPIPNPQLILKST
ncbi:unnamed protein product [Ceratitis capitata]|uniref:(Mediterranean fruit fly) hypothetical protein n=1 Tax=Ceratitis capitata TaxID=7213 RepID=A0A811UI17_CERCA|nr:unnamed protein product [Ceratitis capitata]